MKLLKPAVMTMLLMIISLWLYCSLKPNQDLTLAWQDDILRIYSDNMPGGELKVWYLEAFCRAGSTDRDWNETVIGHTTELVSASDDGKRVELKSTLDDGVIVHHTITAGADEVVFRVTAHNPTDKPSKVHWAQPCVRVDSFTGLDQASYLDKSFIFVNGKLARMPMQPWATKARYTPGQVWRPKNVPPEDVNPRPLSSIIPDNGLIGCFSDDEKMIFATAWSPWQELFQGIIVCLHSDFRIGGLKPGETKNIHGKIYLMKNNVEKLLARYRQDFPEQFQP